MARKAKKGVKYWKKKATEEWSRVIRQVGKCEICGRKGKRGKTQGWTNLDAHHLIPKGTSGEYAGDLSNGVCLCKHCHRWHPQLSPHQNREGFERWLKANRPGQWIGYEEHYPKDKEKLIGGEIVMCRRVKTSGRKIKWEQIYNELRQM